MLPRIHICRNKIRLKAIGAHSTPLHFSVVLRYYTTKTPKPSFETNLSKLDNEAKNDKQIVNSGLSGMLVRFIQKESQILRELMNLEEALDPELDTGSIEVPVALREKLEREIDDYGRFLLLLTHHPLSIPPRLMMHYYSALPAISPQERNQLLKYLVFHNCWYEFWLVGVFDSTTMSDVEELIDLAQECLIVNNNLELGIWQCLAAAHLVTSNLGLLNTICENVEFRLDLDKGAVEHFFKFLFSMHGATDVAKLHQLTGNVDIASNKTLRSFYFRKLAGLVAQDPDAITAFLHDVQQDTELASTPGFASFLLNADQISDNLHDKLSKGFVSCRKSHLNDYDYFCISQSSLCQLRPTFISLCKNIKRNLVKCDQTLSMFVEKAVAADLDLATTMAQKFSPAISAETWILLIPHLLRDESRALILKKFRKAQPAKFQKVIDSFLLEAKKITDLDILKLMDISDGHPNLIRNLLRKLTSDERNLQALAELDLSAYNLLEIMRYALKHLMINETTFHIVDKIFHQTWNLANLSRQATFSHSEKNIASGVLADDFRSYYRAASERDRKALLRNIQALAQTLSLCSPLSAARFLNELHLFIFSDKFTFVKSATGRSYIFDRIVAKTMHFIYRNNCQVPKKGVLVIRNVLSQLKFDSTVTQAALFEHIVYDDPEISIGILKNYRDSKAFLTTPLMEGIQIGILKSAKFSPVERLQIFEKFEAARQDLGYKSKMTTKTMARFGDLIFKVGKERGDVNELGWVIKLGYERGVPVKVIKNWSLMLKQ